MNGKTVGQAISESLALEPPMHVLTRVAALVGAEKVMGVLGGRTAENSGWVAVFTQSIVCHAVWDDSDTDFPNAPGANDTGDSTVTARAWPRAALQSVSIEKDTEHNADSKWRGLWGTSFPPNTLAKLAYSNGVELDVRLPALSEFDDKLSRTSSLITELTKDLVRT